MITFAQIEDFLTDGFCSSCGGKLHEVQLIDNDDKEIYPQVCINCGNGLPNNLTQAEKTALLIEINEALNE